MGFVSHNTSPQSGNSKTGKTHRATRLLRIHFFISALLPSGRHQCLLSQPQTAAETPGIHADMITAPQKQGLQGGYLL